MMIVERIYILRLTMSHNMPRTPGVRNRHRQESSSSFIEWMAIAIQLRAFLSHYSRASL